MAHFYLMLIYFAMMGVDRKMGFWGYFFASLLLSPLPAFLLTIVSDPVPDQKEE